MYKKNYSCSKTLPIYQYIFVSVPADGRQRVEGYWSGSVTVYVWECLTMSLQSQTLNRNYKADRSCNFMYVHCTVPLLDSFIIAFNHRLNLELDLQSFICTAVLIGWDPATPPSPRIWAHIRGRYWSAKIDDISLWPPAFKWQLSAIFWAKAKVP